MSNSFLDMLKKSPPLFLAIFLCGQESAFTSECQDVPKQGVISSLRRAKCEHWQKELWQSGLRAEVVKSIRGQKITQNAFENSEVSISRFILSASGTVLC